MKSVQSRRGNRHLILERRNQDTSVGQPHFSPDRAECSVCCYHKPGPHGSAVGDDREEVAVARDILDSASFVNGSAGGLSG